MFTQREKTQIESKNKRLWNFYRSTQPTPILTFLFSRNSRYNYIRSIPTTDHNLKRNVICVSPQDLKSKIGDSVVACSGLFYQSVLHQMFFCPFCFA